MAREAQKERNADMAKRMLDVTDIDIGPLPKDSPWIKPVRLAYVQDKRLKFWDTMRAHDSVCIIVYNKSRDKMVFVRQFRPASYYINLKQREGKVDLNQYPPELGLSLELCAGMVDKDKPLVEIARDELKEECGYEAKAEDFYQIITYRNKLPECALIATDKLLNEFISDSVALQTLFYVEVTDDMLIHSGGGCDSEGELIEVVEMDIEEVKNYVNAKEVLSPPSFLYGVSWFFMNKYKKNA